MGILLLIIVSPKHGEGREAIYQLDMSLPALAHLAEPNRIAERTPTLWALPLSLKVQSLTILFIAHLAVCMMLFKQNAINRCTGFACYQSFQINQYMV